MENNNNKAFFTKFENGTNWCEGKIGIYNFQAKLFEECSTFGVNNGRVSKICIWDDFSAGCIVNYERGWDIRPKKEFEQIFNAVMELLENAPKRYI